MHSEAGDHSSPAYPRSRAYSSQVLHARRLRAAGVLRLGPGAGRRAMPATCPERSGLRGAYQSHSNSSAMAPCYQAFSTVKDMNRSAGRRLVPRKGAVFLAEPGPLTARDENRRPRTQPHMGSRTRQPRPGPPIHLAAVDDAGSLTRTLSPIKPPPFVPTPDYGRCVSSRMRRIPTERGGHYRDFTNRETLQRAVMSRGWRSDTCARRRTCRRRSGCLSRRSRRRSRGTARCTGSSPAQHASFARSLAAHEEVMAPRARGKDAGRVEHVTEHLPDWVGARLGPFQCEWKKEQT